MMKIHLMQQCTWGNRSKLVVNQHSYHLQRMVDSEHIHGIIITRLNMEPAILMLLLERLQSPILQMLE